MLPNETNTDVAEMGDIAALLERFRLKEFRPGQREVIEAVIGGRDVLCVMPTGGGKSLCYQLPALALQGVTLVVSPLIALMKDQEDQLHRLGIRATALHSGIELAEQRNRLDAIGRNEFDLVYVAPERFRSSRFIDLIAGIGIARLAVDEAHCISEWGHDFRPDYARLGWFRQRLGMPPTIALTATATDLVRRDIAGQLGLRDPAIFIRGFDRPNLRYGVALASTKAQKITRLREMLEETPGSAIVYTTSRKNCEEVSDFIREHCRRSVVMYHAGLQSQQRRESQDAFMNGAVDVVVATNAFGMGVDKPDIRAVIHYNVPGTLEAYYQEAGRAGRDGKPARCELLFSTSDRMIQEYFIENEYPDKRLVYQVLEFLRSLDEEMIELTRPEIRERLGGKASEMAIGAALQLLEAGGALERMRPRENMAIVRLHETGPDLTDLVPASAKNQRAALRYIQTMVGDKRGEDCYFSPDRAAMSLGMDRHALVQAIHDLSARMQLEYFPPFRGSATRLIDRTTPPEQLPIDFEQLEERKRCEYEKLDRVFDYCQNTRCRRTTILAYFGERCGACGNCDRCENSGKANSSPSAGVSQAPAAASNENVQTALRTILEAIAELRGRFGKTLIAQTLTGSESQAVRRCGLQKRNCFGKLGLLRQCDVAEIVDGMLGIGMAEQTGDRMRPLVAITEYGLGVLRGESAFPDHLPIPVRVAQQMQPMGRRPNHENPVAGPANAIRRTDEAPLQTPSKAPIENGERSDNVAKVANSARPAEWTRPAVVAGHPDHYWTWRLLDSGFNLIECAAIRGLRQRDVIQHAIRSAEDGREVDLGAFEAFLLPDELADLSDRLRHASECE